MSKLLVILLGIIGMILISCDSTSKEDYRKSQC